MDTVDEPRKVGLIRVEFWPEFLSGEETPQTVLAKRALITRKTTKHYMAKGEGLSDETLEKLKTGFEMLEKGGTQRNTKYGRSTDHCLPKLHGTLPTKPKPKVKKLSNDALRSYFLAMWM